MDQADVVKTSRLSRLKLTDGELATFTEQLTGLLEYIEILNEVDTDDVEPMAHAVELSDVFREDEPRESLPRSDALANAPKTDGECFLVPPILERA